mgnify:FL=1
MGFLFRTLLITFLAWLVVRVIMINKTLRTLGFGVPVFNHNPGPCKLFHVNGSEDIDVLPNGLAIFSSGLYYSLNPAGVDPAMLEFKGILYSFDLNDPDAKPTPLSYENFDGSEFKPHGIDFYIDAKTQEISLFVVNHAAGNHSIEIFQFDQTNMVLKHKQTVADKMIYSPNDVVAVGPDSFYATNDRYFRNAVLRILETAYPLKFADVVFYNGSQARSVAGGFHGTNGIQIDPSGKYVFVVSSIGGEVVIFERSDENDLIARQRINVGKALDNVNVDKDGNLWLGVANIAIVDYSKNFSLPCPGAVLQMKLSKVVEDGKVPFQVDDIREVFSNDGKGEFKCVASALFHRGKLLIGNPFSNLMYCDVVAI